MDAPLSTRFSTIDLSQLPAPQVIDPLSFEGVLADQKAYVLAAWAQFQERDPTLPDLDTLMIEGEPITIVLEAYAYRETLLRGLINDKAKALLLAFAVGNDLDQIGADYEVERLTVTPADPTTNPPTLAVMEDDDRYRRRIQLAPNAFSMGGPRGAYIYWALTSDPSIADANAISPGVAGQADGKVNVYVAGYNGQPVADAVITNLYEFFQRDDVRPLTDVVSVVRAGVVSFAVSGTLWLPRGPDPTLLKAQAQAAVLKYGAGVYKIGGAAYRNAIIAAGIVGGVQNFVLDGPAQDQICDATQVPYLNGVSLATRVQ
jgi:phage-related baseplate assembly protein